MTNAIRTKKGLGRRFNWRAYLELENAQGDLWECPLDAPCDCYDG